MGIDTKKAFNFIFNDKNWLQKILIGGAFYIVANIFSSMTNLFQSISKIIQGQDPSMSAAILIFLIPFALFVSLICVVLASVPNGYILQSMHNEIKEEEPLLPDWSGNYKKYLKVGIISYGIELIYGLAITIIAIFPLTLVIGVSFFSGNDIVANNLLSAITFIALFTLFLCWFFVSPFVKAAYAENFVFKDAFRLSKIFGNILDMLGDYFLVIGIVLLMFVAYCVTAILLVCTCLGIILVPFLTLPFMLIITNMFAQLYKTAIKEEAF